MPEKPLFCLAREVNTNQKINIDLSVDGKWLVSGGTDGKVQVWDVSENVEPTVHKQVCVPCLLTDWINMYSWNSAGFKTRFKKFIIKILSVI